MDEPGREQGRIGPLEIEPKVGQVARWKACQVLSLPQLVMDAEDGHEGVCEHLLVEEEGILDEPEEKIPPLGENACEGLEGLGINPKGRAQGNRGAGGGLEVPPLPGRGHREGCMPLLPPGIQVGQEGEEGLEDDGHQDSLDGQEGQVHKGIELHVPHIPENEKVQAIEEGRWSEDYADQGRQLPQFLIPEGRRPPPGP